ncbi:MAG: hypothetical protein DYH15_07900 [Nitrosomonas sp. PRO4]|nr:hypothetical protein [Nitrosomonas sp. PRO4]
MTELEPYHFVAYRLWLEGYDLSTLLYPSRAFKMHCEAIKAFSGADVSVPLTSSTNGEYEDADAMTSASEEARQASGVYAHSEA